MQYLMIHYVDENIELSRDEQAKVDGALSAWIGDMARRGISRHGSRLRPPADATTVRVRGSETLVADGPFAETKEQIAGYDLIDCADLDEALEVAAGHPTAFLGAIEVRPLLVS
jgi:hypothetical protein